MRIAYVALGIEAKNMAGGVGRKIRTQTRLWAELGHSARLFALVPECRDADVYTYEPASRLPVVAQLTRAGSRSRALDRLIEDVDRFGPDLIYLRTSGYVFPLHKLFRIARVVLELNSNDLAEKALRGPFAYWLHRWRRELVASRVSGFVAVTQEIGALPENTRYGVPVCVIGNGIDLMQYDPLPSPQHATPVVTLVGSPGMQWHGVDKLLGLARSCPDLQINIVGYTSNELGGDLPGNAHARGFLDAAAVKEMLRDTDVACSSLALHRNRMQDGSSLKVPEALAYGIPILLAYRDSGLEAFESDAILRLPNTEDNVASNAEQIRSFAYRMRGKRIERDEVALFIDQRRKEVERLAFFERVLQDASHA